MDWLVGTAKSLHTAVGFRLRQIAIDIWCLGRVLKREKEIVGRGNWMDHCRRCHQEISLDSIERYMRVSQIPIDQLPAIMDKTPRQAYLMLGLVKKKPSLPTHIAKQNRGKENSSHMRNSAEDSWKRALISCPYCDETIEFESKGECLIARRA